MRSFTQKMTLIVSLLILTGWSVNIYGAPKSPFSGLEIPEHCEQAYATATEHFQTQLQQGFPFQDARERDSLFQGHVDQYPEDDECRFYAALGLHDGQSYVRQQIVLELMLEYKEYQSDDLLADDAWENVVGLYRDRLTAIGLDDTSDIDTTLAKPDLITETVGKLAGQLNHYADLKRQAIPFGRFVFVGGDYPAYTTYDYDHAPCGRIKVNRDGQMKTTLGSYQRLSRRHFERTKALVEDYLAWQPSIFFGEDSFWYGSFWRYFSRDPEPSVREVKEQGYFDAMKIYVNGARRLRLNMEPYNKMYRLMLDKEKATLERDLHAYDRVDKLKWAALFVPVGMYVGAAAMASTGWLAAVPAGSSFVYLGGSLGYAANVSAAISLGTMVTYAGIGGYQAYRSWQDADSAGRPFSAASAMDLVVMASFQSFQLAAIAPVVVGGSMLAGKTAWVAGRTLLSGTLNLGRNIYQAGFSGTMRNMGSYAVQLPGKLVNLPRFAVQKWLEAWWKNPKLLLTHYGVDIALSVGFDCAYYRQTQLEGDSRCVYRDEDGNLTVNRQYLYSLGHTVVIGPLAKPLALIPSFGGRFVAYSAFYTFSSVLVHLSISGEIDTDRLVFDRMYGSTVGTVTGELNHAVKFSDFVQRQSAGGQAALLILFKAVIMRPLETPLYVGLQDRYLRGELSPMEEVKDLVKNFALIDIDDIPNDDLEAALEAIGHDQELMTALEEGPSF